MPLHCRWLKDKPWSNYGTSHFTKEDLDGELAVCPVCHTQFSLRYGTPFNLTYEIYPLKGYPISKVGNKLIVNY